MGTFFLLLFLGYLFLRSGLLIGSFWLMIALGVVHHNYDVGVPAAGYFVAFLITFLIKLFLPSRK